MTLIRRKKSSEIARENTLRYFSKDVDEPISRPIPIRKKRDARGWKPAFGRFGEQILWMVRYRPVEFLRTLILAILCIKGTWSVVVSCIDVVKLF